MNDPARGFDDITVSSKREQNYHQDDWAAFIKDDWNVTQNLTLNYGVRWDVYGVPYEAIGLNTAAKDNNIEGIGSGSLTEIITVGKNSLNTDLSLFPKDWNNFAPSFGFSYRVPVAGPADRGPRRLRHQLFGSAHVPAVRSGARRQPGQGIGRQLQSHRLHGAARPRRIRTRPRRHFRSPTRGHRTRRCS